ncbi:MAG: HAMP domain-containing histidine kinase [Ilumatobacteraceae bacterium]|jgi:signal transduction histidine kinase|nr:HAMP domain-containing histidine kinase [Ilumatobacteraceae bacterium]
MRKRLAAAFVGLTLLLLVIQDVPLVSYLARVERDRLTTALERDAFLLAARADATLSPLAGTVITSLEPIVNEYKARSKALVVITNEAGLAVASTDPAIAVGENYANRPEIAGALSGVPQVGERDSRTLSQVLVYVAVPVVSGDEVHGVVRLSYPKSVVDKEVRERLTGIIAVAAVSLLVAVAAALLLAEALSRPLRRLRQLTEKLSAGDLDVRADDADGPPEVRELARSFNLMAGRLSENLEHQKAFAGEVSHQLRTPLTALRLRLEHAQGLAAETHVEIEEDLEASRAETDRLQSLVEQLLVLARLEGGVSRVVTVNVAEVLTARHDMWTPLAGEKGVSIVVECSQGLMCRAIDGALEQIIDNYIDNALSVAPEGSSLSLHAVRDGYDVVIKVVDEGPGLSEEDRQRAFTRFWRGSSRENDGGSGLGLAIVQQLATASGGHAELRASPVSSTGISAEVRLPTVLA